MSLSTPLTKLFGIKHPIIQAGMNQAAGPELAAAVCKAGGMGCIGGLNYTPKMLRHQIRRLKELLGDDKLPFGVDLLLPKVGGTARKTNYDYTQGKLEELAQVIIEEGAALFVCAVGLPPKWLIDRLHDHNIVVMNMVGLPKHAQKALDLGCDMVCPQGYEAGGHTGDLATSVLVPAVCDLVTQYRMYNGEPAMCIAAGGIYDGRGLAMALALGAAGVWVGTRFVACVEAGASRRHQQELLSASFDSTTRTLYFTGRPLRVKKSALWKSFESDKRKSDETLAQGKIPYEVIKEDLPAEMQSDRRLLMGQNAGAIHDILPAKQIVETMVEQCRQQIDLMHMSKL